MGILAKTTLQTYIPATTGFSTYWPGESETRAIKTTTRVCTWSSLDYSTTSEDTASTRRPTSKVKTCEDVTTIEYVTTTESGSSTSAYPEPAKVLSNFQIGWNARAHSWQTLAGAGEFLFDMPAAVSGAVVGMTERPQSSGYDDIRFGFQQVGKNVSIMELGVVVASLGATPAASFSLRRTNGNVEYRVNDVLVRTVADFPTTMYLSAAFYSGGDSVIDAQMEVINEASMAGSSAPMDGVFNDGSTYAFIVGDSPAMEGSFFAKNKAGLVASVAAMAGIFSDGAGYSFMDGDAPAPSGSFDALGALPYSIMAGYMPAPEGIFTCLSGSVGSMHGLMMPIEGIFSEGPYCFVDGAAPAASGLFTGLEAGNQASIVSFSDVTHDLTANTRLFVLLNSSMEVTGLFTLQTVLSALVESGFTIDDDMTTSQVLKALLASIMDASIQVGQHAEPMTVWALNMDVNGSTRYENYDFNSFAELDGVYYGARQDGIYKLEGRDDNGADVSASVNFGNLSFGSINRKALPYLYAGVASDGNLRLKVVADGQTYFYTVRDNTELLKAHRFELGRGLQASYYDITILNDGGSAFQLTDIEFFPLELKRRL